MSDHKYSTNLNSDGQSEQRIPDTKGYDERGNCNNCGKSSTEEGSEYEDPKTGNTLVDVFCTFCGSILETKEVE